MGRRFRWSIATCMVLILGFGIWTGGYYYVAARWPWEPRTDVAAMVLQASDPIGTSSAGTTPEASYQPLRGARQSHDATPSAEAAATPVPTATPVPLPTGPGTMQDGQIASTFMNATLPYRIYLPSGYNDPANANTRYPVVYLLHGAPGSFTDWSQAAQANTTADALIQTGRIPPMLLVMPEGECNWKIDTEWANGSPPALQAESYMVQEVVPYIDSNYRTIADSTHRSIGGLSTGAYGGVNIALHHPDVFSTAWGISGVYRAPRTLLKQPICTDADCTAYNSPADYVAQLANPAQMHVLLITGSQDQLDNTVGETQAMEQALTNVGVPHQVLYPDGGHSWDFWSLHLVDALEYSAATFAGA